MRVVAVGAAANLLLAAAKVGVGILAHSQALVADGIHSVSDLATDLVVLAGARFWTTPPDAAHPYGHGRVETLVNVFIGLALAVTSIGIAWEGIHTISGNESVSPGWSALAVGIISLVGKEALFRWTVHKGRACGSSALVSNAWHHRSDALSSVPVIVAVVVGWLAPHLTFLDPIAAVLVAMLLLKASWEIVRPAAKELLEAQDPGLVQEIHDMAEAKSEVCAVYDIRTRRVGSAVFVDLKMLVDPDLSVAAVHALQHDLESEVKRRHPAVVELLSHAEPGIEAPLR